MENTITPHEIIINKENDDNNSITVQIPHYRIKPLILFSNHNNKNNNDQYIDTTYYDISNKLLNISNQELKIFPPNLHTYFSSLIELYMDNNNITTLPQTPNPKPHI